MSFVGFLCSFVLGFLAGGVAGIVFGFAWYERKCGLLVGDDADIGKDQNLKLRARQDPPVRLGFTGPERPI